MRKVKTIGGFVIGQTSVGERLLELRSTYEVYTREEWDYGDGYRSPEFECDTIQECEENIKSY